MDIKHRIKDWGKQVLLALCGVLAVGTQVAAQDIVLGQIGPFTGLPVPDAPQINQGARAYIAQANKAGGVNGRKITLFEVDDTYKPDGFVKAMEQAMQRKPLALISPVGSASIKRMLDDKLLDKYDVLVMNGVPGAEALRNPGHPRFFHVRAGDRQQLEEIVKHASTLGMTRLVVLHQDIPMGASGLRVVTDEVAKRPGMTVRGVPGSVDPLALAKAAAEVAKLDPQGVIVIGAPPFAAAGVAQLRKAGVTQSIFLLADTAPGLLVKVAGVEAARGVGIAQIYPNPNGKTRALVREFQAAMKAAYPEVRTYAPFQLEGYVVTRVLVEAMRRVKGELTPAAIGRALQAMGEIDYDGYRLDFSKGNIGGRYVDIAVVDAEGRLRY
jgi:ABC-type branched-subunit amino acid transport system substrate-binding protein